MLHFGCPSDARRVVCAVDSGAVPPGSSGGLLPLPSLPRKGRDVQLTFRDATALCLVTPSDEKRITRHGHSGTVIRDGTKCHSGPTLKSKVKGGEDVGNKATDTVLILVAVQPCFIRSIPRSIISIPNSFLTIHPDAHAHTMLNQSRKRAPGRLRMLPAVVPRMISSRSSKPSSSSSCHNQS